MNKMALLIDARTLQKPNIFDNSETGWKEWKFKMVTYMGLVDPVLPDFMEEAEQRAEPVEVRAEDDDNIRRSRTLYAMLATHTTGRALRIIQGTVGRNGFEAWRLLSEEFAPKVVQRRLASLNVLLRPKINVATLRDDLADWEKEIRDYEQMTGKDFDKELKIGIVMNAVPLQLRNHLQPNATSVENDFNGLKRIIDAYALATHRWTIPGTSAGSGTQQQGQQDTSTDMEVDMLAKGKKGKGKGKRKDGKSQRSFFNRVETYYGKGGHSAMGKKGGKGQGQGKGQGKGGFPSTEVAEDACRICGKRGHWGNECWYNDAGKAKAKGKGGKQKGVNEVEAMSSSASSAGQTAVSMLAVRQVPYPMVEGQWLLAIERYQEKQKQKEVVAPRARHFKCMEVVLDSGSAIHVCPKDFGDNEKLEWSEPLKLTAAGGHQIKHYGKKRVKLDFGPFQAETRFGVPDVRRALLSVSRMTEAGWEINFGPGECVLKAPDGRTAKGRMEKGLYVMKIKILETTKSMPVMPVETDDDMGQVGAEGPGGAEGSSEAEWSGGAEGAAESGWSEGTEGPEGAGGSKEVAEAENSEELEDAYKEAQRAAGDGKAKGLKLPARKPEDQSVESHRLTHLPFQHWCEECVRSRAKDNPHKRKEARRNDRRRPLDGRADRLQLCQDWREGPGVDAAECLSYGHRIWIFGGDYLQRAGGQVRNKMADKIHGADRQWEYYASV